MKQNPFDFATAYDLFCQKSVKRFSVDIGKVKQVFISVFQLFIILKFLKFIVREKLRVIESKRKMCIKKICD